MSKIFQIRGKTVSTEYTGRFIDLEDARAHFASNIILVEAPDKVFPGWAFDDTKQGDERFIQPIPGDGQAYNPHTGEIWIPEETRMYERRNLHAETTNDTLEALRKIREGDQTIDWSAWLDQLDAYNLAIEATKEPEGYPLKVTYPEYPTKPTKNATGGGGS